MAEAVRIVGLKKAFGSTKAVDNISLEIEPGELFFLLGPSGCGKTTLLRCIAGFCEPDQGDIFIGDAKITRMPPHRRDTGMVFQSYALWPHLTVSQNVAFGLEMRNVPKKEAATRVASALEMVRMAEKATAKPNELSGGQQQRVALARALVIHPKCLLLDEPLSNLDAKLRLEMRSEIRRICKSVGLTAIYVTHDQKEALSIADRLAVLDGGHISQVGAPQTVYRVPNSRFVADFIGETNFLEGTVDEIGADRTIISTPIGSLETSAPVTLPAGRKVTVSLRPEAIRLGEAPKHAVNVFTSMVHHTVYLGELAQHEVLITGKDQHTTALKAMEVNPRIVAHEGATESPAWIEPEDVVVLES